ncbi:MAG TPA: glycerol-3-phosphate acyltransferase [Chloroflexia bacterium]|nr:glycerol-3-phosphate acyltransferase [Chloroflexia bacterium]
MSDWLQLTLIIAGAYLIGAIPGGLLVGMIMGRNLLEGGSGKTGTANALSVLGRPAAIAVFALDLIKGVAAVLLARLLSWPNEAWLAVAMGLAASAAIVGHNWSVWVRLLAGRWGGGRGIVTALGAMLTVQPLVILAAVLAGITVLAMTRYVVLGTLAGIAASMVTIILLVLLKQVTPWLLPGTIAWGLLVVAGFGDSIGRLLKGSETRLGQS